VADELSGVNKGAVQIMDLAAGSGVWSIPFAENNPSAHIDAVDFQAILAVTEKITKKRELFSQYSFLPGDWRDIEWKSSFYDIITLGHILHSEGEFESKKLLAKCFEALKVGGKIVVAEFLCNELRDGPVPALLFELNMLLHTRDGCVFSVDHLSELVYDVGFKRPVTYSAVIDGKPILIGTK
jgi:ubiquinone/menaquinone biosynthesis C-methylase UbiE